MLLALHGLGVRLQAEALLTQQLTKLPRNLRGGEITNVRRRLDAVSTAGGGLPIPKGPMPTSSRSVRRQR